MIKVNPELEELLNSSDTFRMADLYEFKLKNGVTLYYTDADIDVRHDGHVYKCDELLIQRDTITLSVGLEVDDLTLTIMPSSNAVITNGLTFQQMLTKGLFDNARFKLKRAFFSQYGLSPVGVITRFVGLVSDLDFGRTEVSMTVSSLTSLLDIKMPRNLVETSCTNTLFDHGCALNKDDYGVSGTAQDGSTVVTIFTGLTEYADDYFTLGTITFTSGLNQGISRTIKTHESGSVTPIVPFPNIVNMGDSFILYPGCDRTQDCCKNKFNNLQRFKGCPYVPTSEDVSTG